MFQHRRLLIPLDTQSEMICIFVKSTITSAQNMLSKLWSILYWCWFDIMCVYLSIWLFFRVYVCECVVVVVDADSREDSSISEFTLSTIKILFQYSFGICFHSTQLRVFIIFYFFRWCHITNIFTENFSSLYTQTSHSHRSHLYVFPKSRTYFHGRFFLPALFNGINRFIDECL